MPKTRTWGALGALLILLGCSLSAQNSNEDTSTRSVQGVVSDAAGNAAPKAVVQLKDTKTLQIRSYITEVDGSYHFASLSTNVEYQVKADHEGATSGWKTLSVFNTKKVATLNLKLNK